MSATPTSAREVRTMRSNVASRADKSGPEENDDNDDNDDHPRHPSARTHASSISTMLPTLHTFFDREPKKERLNGPAGRIISAQEINACAS